MRILITNDDGIAAPGLLALANVAREFGEVRLVAPSENQSACSHSMTLHDPIRATEYNVAGLQGFSVTGKPVDCVNVGLELAWPDGCDLVLSGINNGPNLGFDVTYSGTVGGAMEGAINGIKSFAISMASFVQDAPLHFETGGAWLRENWSMLVNLPFSDLSLWNINIPAIAYPEIVGHQFVPMGRRVYEERLEERSDPWGRPYYWQGGVVIVDGKEQGTDVWAVSNGYVALTPIKLDWTDHSQLEKLRAGSAPLSPGSAG